MFTADDIIFKNSYCKNTSYFLNILQLDVILGKVNFQLNCMVITVVIFLCELILKLKTFNQLFNYKD